jgi:peptide/nickel transport system substrate-binding protein
MKKFGYLAMVSVLLMVVSMFVSPISAAPPPIKRPDEMIAATIEGGMPETVDPAWAYDTASGELIFNVYDVLITFDAEHMDAYLGRVATEWVIENITGTKSPEGLDWYFRYTFKIRTGIKFHDGGTLTPEDVEYSFERAMVQDRDGGPTWMFYEPLLNTWGAFGLLTEEYGGEGEYDVVTVGKMIDHAVESNATHVWFNLAFPGAYTPFLQILSQTWSSIMSKNWVKNYVIGELGRPDWDGEWGDYTTWIGRHNPEISPLDDPSPIMMGSGPFKFETLDSTAKYWSIVRNENYWAGWPADFPLVAGAKPAGYINRATVTWAYTWETRSTMFLAGDVDFCAVPRQYMGTVLGKDGIRCIYPLPLLAVDNLFFTFEIDPATPYGPILAAGTFAETGVPSDFFGNPTWGIHNRKAFAYAFDYERFLAEAYLGEAMAPATAIIPGLVGYDPTVKGYTFDLKKAEEEFKKVPGLWDKGFTMTLLYNTGNIPRQRACEILKANLESLNPKFHLTISSVDWKPYLRAMIKKQLTCFIIGWLADFPDPHNFATPFYASWGTFSAWQGYSNPAMDELIEKGIKEVDPNKRVAIYHDIQVLAIEDCPSVTLDQAIGRHWERDWVVGWYYNPIYPGAYFYNLWKWYYVPHSLLDTSTQPTSNQLPTDVNYDGKTDIKDIYTLARSFGSSFGPPVHPRWVYRADINNDRKIDIRDIYAVAKNFGKSSATWSP